jgi:hypothetical protein
MYIPPWVRYTALPGSIKKSSRAQVYNRPWEMWWLNGTAPDCCPAVLGSYPVSPQPTADCQSPGGLPPGMALGCGVTSVRGNRGEDYKNESLVRQKHKKKKNLPSSGILYVHPSLDQVKNALAQVQYTSLSGSGICTSLPGSGIQPSLDQVKNARTLVQYTLLSGSGMHPSLDQVKSPHWPRCTIFSGPGIQPSLTPVKRPPCRRYSP